MPLALSLVPFVCRSPPRSFLASVPPAGVRLAAARLGGHSFLMPIRPGALTSFRALSGRPRRDSQLLARLPSSPLPPAPHPHPTGVMLQQLASQQLCGVAPTAPLRLIPIALRSRIVAQAAQTLRVCWLRSRPSDGCLRKKNNIAF